MLAAPSYKIRAIAVLCAVLCYLPLHADDTIEIAADGGAELLLADAESLLASGRSDDAYALLKPREQQLAGNALFDYLLGIAALDSGFYSEAVFSLRRSVAVAPDFAGARMELARAYFESDNKSLARSLFVGLLDEQPPPGVRAVIDDYLAAIDTKSVDSQARFVPYTALSIGYDSNANGSTDNENFLGFTLSPDNLETDTSFFTVGAGFNFSKSQDNRFGWYAGGHANHRRNPDASFVDATLLSGLGGFNWQRGGLFGHAGVDAWWATRDGDPNASYAGIDALVGKRFSGSWELTAGLRGGALRHDDSIEVLDVDRVLYTGGLNYRFSPLGSVGIELLGGGDSETRSGSPYGNSKFGGRFVLHMPVGRTSQLFFSTGSLKSDYDGLFFGVEREDTQLTSTLQIRFYDVFTEGLSFIPRLRHIDNDSDVALYDYDRIEFGLLMQWTPQ